jgi:hypothetical protein
MPRYFFVIEGDDHPDSGDDGTQLDHPEAARLHAKRIIRELRDAGGYDDPSLALFVKDTSGEVLSSVPFIGSLH